MKIANQEQKKNMKVIKETLCLLYVLNIKYIKARLQMINNIWSLAILSLREGK